MAQKLRKHGKKLEKTSVGCDIDFNILLSMLKVKDITWHSLMGLNPGPGLGVSRVISSWSSILYQ